MYIEAPELSSFMTIRHAFFTRQGGVSTGLYSSLNGGLGSADNPDHIRENRRRMAESLEVAEPMLISLYQVHSPTVIVVEEPWGETRPQADAMVTSKPGIALGIATADCGPVLFADTENSVVGAAHAGWKGAIGGVLEATVTGMEKLGADRSSIVAVLGPTISQKNYEVSAEFREQFMQNDGANNAFFLSAARENHYLFDLPGYIAMRLEKTGIGVFSDVDCCTYEDEEKFFSYRRATHRHEPDYGRQISAIRLTH